MKEQKHIMTMLVDNQPGVLSRVVGLFSGKGFNIESLCVAPTMDPQVSRITIVTMANPPVIEQIEKQLRKLINVIKLRDMTGPKAVKREMALICVRAKPEHRAEDIDDSQYFRAMLRFGSDTNQGHFPFNSFGAGHVSQFNDVDQFS